MEDRRGNFRENPEVRSDLTEERKMSEKNGV